MFQLLIIQGQHSIRLSPDKSHLFTVLAIVAVPTDGSGSGSGSGFQSGFGSGLGLPGMSFW